MKWIRPWLSLIAMLGITTGFFLGKISTDAYMGVTTFIITWWFKSRDEEKSNNNSTSTDIAKIIPR